MPSPGSDSDLSAAANGGWASADDGGSSETEAQCRLPPSPAWSLVPPRRPDRPLHADSPAPPSPAKPPAVVAAAPQTADASLAALQAAVDRLAAALDATTAGGLELGARIGSAAAELDPACGACTCRPVDVAHAPVRAQLAAAAADAAGTAAKQAARGASARLAAAARGAGGALAAASRPLLSWMADAAGRTGRTLARWASLPGRAAGSTLAAARAWLSAARSHYWAQLLCWGSSWACAAPSLPVQAAGEGSGCEQRGPAALLRTCHLLRFQRRPSPSAASFHPSSAVGGASFLAAFMLGCRLLAPMAA